MEFVLTTDLSALAPQVIDFNFEQLKSELSQRVQHYNELVVTEDGIQDAKTDRANLRKLREAIDTQRKEVKAACLRPYDAFEKRCKELTSLIDAPIVAIDVQVKSFEETQREEKRVSIESSYQSAVGDMAQFLPLERIWNTRWLNATYKTIDVECEIETAVDQCRMDVSVIRGLDSPFAVELLEQYANGSSLSAVLAKAAALKARQEAEEARKMDEARRKAESADQSTEEHAHATNKPVPSPAPTQEPPYAKASVHEIDFRVWATDDQLSALKAFLIQNNIKYGKVG